MTLTRHMTCILAAVGIAITAPAEALDLSLPASARLTVERNTALDSFDAAIGTYADGHVPMVSHEGAVTRRAWRIATEGLTALQVMAPLREELLQEGYSIAYECDARNCGGFDFRFAIEVLPGPNMYVNIAHYRYLSAFSGPEDSPTHVVSLLTSVTSASAYLQFIAVDTSGAANQANVAPARAAEDPVRIVPENRPEPALVPPPTEPGLLENGHVILNGLEFSSGSSNLGIGPYASLQELASILQNRPELRVALVGHTDTVGGLEANITLSRARARAVRQRLIDTYGIAASRLDAEGMGYLSPISPNRTPEGRERNRRVEAVLLNTQ